MVTIFIALFIIVCCFNLFMFSYQANGINRLVYGIPISLIETAVDIYDIDASSGVYFSRDVLEEKLTSYFDYSIKHYVNDYQLDFYYYNPLNHSYCLRDRCSAFEMTISTTLMMNYHYEKTLYYEIGSH